MPSKTNENSVAAIQAAANEFGQAYVAALDRREHLAAKQIAREAVESLKRPLTDAKEGRADDELNANFFTAILFRALFDFAVLAELTADPAWQSNPPSLEKVWDKLCDCRQRLNFVRPLCVGRTVSMVEASLNIIEEFFEANFGPGLYSSPELLVQRQLCTICGSDIRSCDHLPGHIYRGRLCAMRPDGISIQSCSIVQVPHDRRCRIWPWQVEGQKVSRLIIMSYFRLDDFLEKDDWG